MLCTIPIFLWAYFKFLVTEAPRQWIFYAAASVASVILLADVHALVIVSAGFLAFAGGITFDIVMGISAVAPTGAVTPVIGTVAIACGSAVGFALFWLHEQLSSPRAKLRYWIGFGVFYLTATVAAFAWSLSRSDATEGFMFGVFLVMLPLANSLLDWLSLGVTRGLLYAIHRGHHTWVRIVTWGVLDIGLALVFLFGIAMLTVALVAGMNATTIAWADKPVTDLVGLFEGLAHAPMSLDYAWIHFMMLSTVIPTLIHFAVAGAAVVLAVPNSVRRFITENWDQRNDALTAGLWYVTLVPALGVAFPALALWGGYELLAANHAYIGNALLAWVRWVAAHIDPSFAVIWP